MKKIITPAILTLVIATVAVYFYNGRCFACDTDTSDYCTRHLGPCDIEHASIVYDKCDSNTCPDCNTCDLGGTFTCCYNASYICNDPHLGQVMYDKQCKSGCEATHQPGTPAATALSGCSANSQAAAC